MQTEMTDGAVNALGLTASEMKEFQCNVCMLWQACGSLNQALNRHQSEEMYRIIKKAMANQKVLSEEELSLL